WMRRWLAGVDEPVTEPEAQLKPAADFLCTPRGQVMLLEGAHSVVDLNVALDAGLAPQRRRLWEGRAKALAEGRRLAGVRPLAELGRPKVISAAPAIEREGYRILRYLFEVEDDLLLPALHFVPEKPIGRLCLYLHGQGKHVDAGPGGPIEKL